MANRRPPPRDRRQHISARKGPSAGPSHFWRPLMNSTVVVRADDQAEPSLVVFGRDDAGKPRASWFDAGSADLASKAADLMKMRVLRVETEEQKAVARQLAPGRVLESGRAFTPFARATVFSKLVELAHGAQEAATPVAGYRSGGECWKRRHGGS